MSALARALPFPPFARLGPALWELADRILLAAASGHLGRAARLCEQSAVDRRRGDTGRARMCAERATRTFAEFGDRRGQALALNSLGLAVRAEDVRLASRSFRRAIGLLEDLGDREAADRVRANLGLLRL